VFTGLPSTQSGFLDAGHARQDVNVTPRYNWATPDVINRQSARVVDASSTRCWTENRDEGITLMNKLLATLIAGFFAAGAFAQAPAATTAPATPAAVAPAKADAKTEAKVDAKAAKADVKAEAKAAKLKAKADAKATKDEKKAEANTGVQKVALKTSAAAPVQK
jgi:hypothetical protein